MNKFATALSARTEARVSRTTTRFAPDGGLALANFVRSFELNSNITPRRRLEVCSGDPASPFDGKHRNLTTGTFNQVVKDRIAFPPERRVFSPTRSRYESSRPRNLLKISSWLLACQLLEFTGFPHRAVGRERRAASNGAHCFSRSRTHLPSHSSAESGQKLTISARAETEDVLLRKDQLEVLAKNA